VDAKSGKTFAVFDPSNGQQIAQVAEGGAEDVAAAVVAMPYNDDDLDHIAKQGNATEYGLAASIWTRDIGIAHKPARKLKAGSVWINVHNVNDVALPFGGYTQSGWGREMGYEAIELYTETKAVAALL
jgi:phenylacetaldehyde dehydrogenase